MSELIDRYATMDAIPEPTDADEAEYYRKICDAIEAMPAIEPEVRHGYWIEPDSETIGKYRDDGCVAYYTCSRCKEISNTDYDFCPNCGVRMDVTDTNVDSKGGVENDAR